MTKITTVDIYRVMSNDTAVQLVRALYAAHILPIGTKQNIVDYVSRHKVKTTMTTLLDIYDLDVIIEKYIEKVGSHRHQHLHKRLKSKLRDWKTLKSRLIKEIDDV